MRSKEITKQEIIKMIEEMKLFKSRCKEAGLIKVVKQIDESITIYRKLL